MADNVFHGHLDRPIGAMRVLEERMAEVEQAHAGHPAAEVYAELQRVHHEMGLQLDPTEGRRVADRISKANPAS